MYTVHLRKKEDNLETLQVFSFDKKECKEKALKACDELAGSEIAILITKMLYNKKSNGDGYIGDGKVYNIYSKYTDEDVKLASEWKKIIESIL